MNKHIVRFAFLFTAFICSVAATGQGWVGTGISTIYAVNSTPSTTPVFVGIGTNAPSAQFHTTGSLRFQNLTNGDTMPRVLVQNTTGQVFWRNASTLGSGSAWQLTGNTGTNPATNFLGTTDNTRLVVRTNNQERMTVLGNGNIGIGLNNPIYSLQIFRAADDGKLAVTGGAPSLRLWGPNATAPTANAVIGLATNTNNYSQSAVAGDLVIGPTTNNAIIFNTNLDNYATVPPDEKMRIAGNGNVGINTFTPAQRLHVNGGVRFENLPAGTGNILVIDANGDVLISNQTARIANGGQDAGVLQQEVETLKKEIAELKKQMAQLMKPSAEMDGSAARLFDSYPNPGDKVTSVQYYLPSNVKEASVVLTTQQGERVRQSVLTNRGRSSISINTATLAAGTYYYSLIADGAAVDTKKLVVAH